MCPRPCGRELVDSKLVGGCGPAEAVPPRCRPCSRSVRGKPLLADPAGAPAGGGVGGRGHSLVPHSPERPLSLDARQLSWCLDTGLLIAVLRELSFPSPGSPASGGLITGGHGRQI